MSNKRIIPISDPSCLSEVVNILNNGGIIAFPTDTVYGLAAPIHNYQAIDRLFSIKGRNFNKAIAVLIGSMDQLPLLTADFSPLANKLASAFWPGALTLIVKIQSGLPSNLSPYPTIGIRMPNHPDILSMLKTTGPLATTSANLSGQPDSLTAEDVIQQLGETMDLVVDGGHTQGAIPSTVVDCTTNELKILRLGSIIEADLKKALL